MAHTQSTSSYYLKLAIGLMCLSILLLFTYQNQPIEEVDYEWTSVRSQILAQIPKEDRKTEKIEEPPSGISAYSPELWAAAKVAVIIETRQVSTLIPLTLHFAATLGPTWLVVIYTSNENYDHYFNNPTLARMRHQIDVRTLPADVSFPTHSVVSEFLTRPWLWENLAPASHVLMFQTDSIICANSEVNIDDFLHWDFIGAPIASAFGKGYNGGLSLRNRDRILRITREHDYLIERSLPNPGDGYSYAYEDQWFVMRLEHMLGSRLPSVEEAMPFAVETIWAEDQKPLGFHQLGRWQSHRVAEVEQWCPEIRLTTGPNF